MDVGVDQAWNHAAPSDVDRAGGRLSFGGPDLRDTSSGDGDRRPLGDRPRHGIDDSRVPESQGRHVGSVGGWLPAVKREIVHA